MELRNPFGLRDNRIILIEDLVKNEKGLRCNCVCPSCKEPFEARMGEIRRHHFAHSGQGCDEVNAYMTGLYMLLNEYLTEGHSLRLPPVIVGFRFSSHSYITQESIEEDTWLLSESVNEEREIQVFGKTNVKFQSCYMEVSGNGKPNAIIATANGRNLAIKITPPDSVCKAEKAQRYKDYPTIEIDLADAGEMIQQSGKNDFFRYLSEQDDIFQWIYNPIIKNVYPQIIKKSKAHYDKEQERMQREAEERKSKEKPKEQGRKTALQNIRHRYNDFSDDKIRVDSVDINGESFAVGTIIKYKERMGKIVEILKLINNHHEIQVIFADNSFSRFDIEVLIEHNLLSRI